MLLFSWRRMTPDICLRFDPTLRQTKQQSRLGTGTIVKSTKATSVESILGGATFLSICLPPCGRAAWPQPINAGDWAGAFCHG